MASIAETTFHFDMQVRRVAEQPRITKPFSDESWAALDALGEQVDAALNAGDVRLTMGGEPTFVSIDDFESAEWNTDAVGPQKRALADKLIRRCASASPPAASCITGKASGIRGEPPALDLLGLLAARRQTHLERRFARGAGTGDA